MGDRSADTACMQVSSSLIVGQVKGVVWPLKKAGWIRWQDYKGNPRVLEGRHNFDHHVLHHG